MRLRQVLSRISIRLMAFNLLLVFLPVAGILYLDSYESKLLAAQRRAVDEEARLLTAALTTLDSAGPLLERHRASRGVTSAPEPVRLRVISPDGNVIADSGRTPQRQPENEARRNVLYRAGATVLRPLLRLFRAEPVLSVADFYENADRLLGDEIRSALEGTPARQERISPDRRSVTLYIAHPIGREGVVTGAVLASQSTFTILQDLSTVRLGIIRIFMISIVVAMILSFLVATTIVRPLRQLRMEAGALVDRSGRLRGRFRGSKKHDEIGDLARALETLTSQLDERVRFTESFAADVSHEFKNPLASIRTATEMLAEVDEPAQRKRFLRMVEQEIARMESLLSGVREITVIDAQLPTEKRQRVDIAALLTRIVEGFTLRERERVHIRLEAPPTAEVDASEDRLIQVFVNVLENAVSFSPDGAPVTITVRRDERMTVTRIADEGPGIPEGNVARVFDRFFTHRPETTRARASHTGLGLAIVKAIVEGYGGSVEATNNTSGGGATFEIRLPSAG
jgi:two-component system sensor histidine kinase ChvG